MDEQVLSCMDFDKDPGKPQCCNSCHDDEDEGYEGLLEIYEGDRMTARVCCVVHTWLEKRANSAEGDEHG